MRSSAALRRVRNWSSSPRRPARCRSAETLKKGAMNHVSGRAASSIAATAIAAGSTRFARASVTASGNISLGVPRIHITETGHSSVRRSAMRKFVSILAVAVISFVGTVAVTPHVEASLQYGTETYYYNYGAAVPSGYEAYMCDYQQSYGDQTPEDGELKQVF